LTKCFERALARASMVRMVAAFVVTGALLCSATMRIAGATSAGEQNASFARLKAAWRDLALGEPRRAYGEFSRELHFWRGLQVQSFGYDDAERGMMIAAIFTRDDARAEAVWQQVGAGTEREPAADSMIFAGTWADALRAYCDASRGELAVDPRPGPDPVIAAGVERALRGDLHGAIVAWSQPTVAAGVWDITDEQTALVGLAHAHLGDWTGAEAAWIRAARTERSMPQIDELFPGNLMGLSMLMHFREHFARGEHAYRWTFRYDPD